MSESTSNTGQPDVVEVRRKGWAELVRLLESDLTLYQHLRRNWGWKLAFGIVLVAPPFAYIYAKSDITLEQYKFAYAASAIELYSEAGANYELAKQDHADVLELYGKTLRDREDRDFALFLNKLFPQYSAEQRLTSIAMDLRNAVDGKKTIEEAADEVYRLYKETADRPRINLQFVVGSSRPPQTMIWVVDRTIRMFCEAAEELDRIADDPDVPPPQKVKQAETACRLSRVGFLFLLHAARNDGLLNKHTAIEEFRRCQELSQKRTSELAEKHGDPGTAKTLSDWAASMDRRLKTIDAMKNGSAIFQKVLIDYLEAAKNAARNDA